MSERGGKEVYEGVSMREERREGGEVNEVCNLYRERDG